MCDRQESRLYGQNFQSEIFATSVAISWGWKPPEKGRMTQKTVFGRKSVMVYIVSMQSRTGEGEAYRTGAPSPPGCGQICFS